MPNPFEEAMAAAQQRIEETFSEEAVLIPMRRASANAAPAPDPGRSSRPIERAVFSERTVRISAAGNALASMRASGFQMAQTAAEIFVEIGEGLVGDVAIGDRIERPKTGQVFAIAEQMTTTIRNVRRYRLNQVAAT
jgi:hypothetical protein